MVRATHAASGAAAFVRAKSGDDGYHRATFGPSDLAAQVAPAPPPCCCRPLLCTLPCRQPRCTCTQRVKKAGNDDRICLPQLGERVGEEFS